MARDIRGVGNSRVFGFLIKSTPWNLRDQVLDLRPPARGKKGHVIKYKGLSFSFRIFLSVVFPLSICKRRTSGLFPLNVSFHIFLQDLGLCLAPDTTSYTMANLGLDKISQATLFVCSMCLKMWASLEIPYNHRCFQ